MLKATNIEQAKLINLWVVFDAVRLHGPLSRADIARLTGLSKQTVSNLADELYEAGLLRPEGRKIAGVGKPSIQLAINPEGGFTIGLQLDRGRLVTVVADLSGQVRERAVQPVEMPSPEQTVPRLKQQVDAIIAEAGIARDQLLGVGLVMPGPFQVEGLGPTSLPGWDGLKIAADLEAAIGLPVQLENDATAAASAEWLYGAARSLSTFVYVFIGIGLGAGLMIEGRAFSGAAGNAGEFGHLMVQPGGLRCDCGNRGCLEAYLSLNAAFQHLAAQGLALQSIEAFEREIAPDDPRLDAWLDAAIEPFRIGLNAVENMFDPEAILLGGDAPDWLLDRLVQRVHPLYRSLGTTQHRRWPRLMRGTLGRDAAARGAAVLPIFRTLNPSYVPLGAERIKPAALRARISTATVQLPPA
ncbi:MULTISPECIES: ROK family transcriptional regulator [unclassified Inquilinus]|uniref:ROK family transcriptional regulator n=1 Tax=unclassified Inquilinus TaxID=2645927 RepID=UPI003F914F4B